jgi:hypothetical protein
MRRYQFVATASVLLCLAGGAAAKERASGCPGVPVATLRIESAIRLGAPVWNAGNQLATYAIYRDLTDLLLAESIPDDRCGPLHETLLSARKQARERDTPGAAGWALRRGFDTFLEYVARGDSPKLLPVPSVDNVVAPFYDRDCPHLFDHVKHAEQALGSGAGETLAFARTLQGALGKTGECPRLHETLGSAAARRNPAPVLRDLINGQPPPSDVDAPPAMLAGCPLLPALATDLTLAIVRGAPRFDEGHPDVCLAVYRKAATDATLRYGRAGACAAAAAELRKGLAGADRAADVAAAAWSLRHAFDHIIEAFARAIPS